MSTEFFWQLIAMTMTTAALVGVVRDLVPYCPWLTCSKYFRTLDLCGLRPGPTQAVSLSFVILCRFLQTMTTGTHFAVPEKHVRVMTPLKKASQWWSKHPGLRKSKWQEVGGKTVRQKLKNFVFWVRLCHVVATDLQQDPCFLNYKLGFYTSEMQNFPNDIT